MKYLVVFHYLDGEKFEVEVSPTDMETFMETLGKGEVYFNHDKGVGVWVAIDKVRYFHVERVDACGDRIVVETPRIIETAGEKNDESN